MRFSEAFASTGTDKLSSHGYDRYYDQIFDGYNPKSLLEIGIKTGRSLASWRLMFPDAYIAGLDITDKFFMDEYIRFSEADVTIADSTKANIKEQMTDTYDVIIDDGSHYYKDLMKTFENFHDRFETYYIIEDYFYDIRYADKFIRKFGFSDVKFYPSRTQNVKVNKTVIFNHTEDRKEYIHIDLHMIVIKR